jgi:hypothetical protein
MKSSIKYINLLYALLVLATLVVWGVYFLNKPETKSVQSIALTKVSIQKNIINVGEIPHHKSVEVIFEIINEGYHPLIIKDVKTDCNCTSPDWQKEPIPPKGVTKIKILYNSHTPGYFQKKALVTCNVDESPIVLVMRGIVIT